MATERARLVGRTRRPTRPGVYGEEIAHPPPRIVPVGTAVPGFIGYTEQALDRDGSDLTLCPQRIESLAEFELYFGGPQPETGITVRIEDVTVASAGTPVGVTATASVDEGARSRHILHYAMQLFYANGGGPCYIVSVGPYKADVGADLDLAELDRGLGTLSTVDEPTLIVIPEAQALTQAADFATLQNNALTQCAALRDRFVIMDVHGGPESLSDPDADLLAAIDSFRTSGPSQSLKYGAAYAPNLQTVLDYAYDDATVLVTEVIDGVASPAAALDTLAGSQTVGRARAAIRDLPMTLPPSPAVAGVYARVDGAQGVWKAPANVSLNAVVRPAIEVSAATNEALTVDPVTGKSVNAIRRFPGRGTLVWGARTLAGNDTEWRYVNVRRFFSFVEESIATATDQLTSAPNDPTTWVTVRAMIEDFLTAQWRAGALQGSKPERAFFVRVGLGSTMTQGDVLEGRMIIEIGLAPVRPAEFVILRISQLMAES